MAKYSVFVPGRKGSEMPDLTIKVEASNWLVALKASLKQIGDQGDSLSNIVCETAADGSLRVADPGSKRVFIIKQVAAEEDDKMAKEAEARAESSRKEAEAAAKAKAEAEARLKAVEDEITGTFPRAPEELPKEEAIKAAKQAEAMRKMEEQRQRLEVELQTARINLEKAAEKAASEATGVLGKVEVKKTSAKARKEVRYDDLDDWYSDASQAAEQTVDQVISDIFLETDNIHEKNENEAATLVLKLASKHVNAEAASVFYSDMNSALKDLVIVAATGPVAKKITGARVPLGRGIVGFSALNAVRLTVNNTDKNPNFYGKLDQEFGFTTKNILCVPILFEDRSFGAIELINKKGGEWTGNDSNILESLARILGRTLDTALSQRKD